MVESESLMSIPIVPETVLATIADRLNTFWSISWASHGIRKRLRLEMSYEELSIMINHVLRKVVWGHFFSDGRDLQLVLLLRENTQLLSQHLLDIF